MKNILAYLFFFLVLSVPAFAQISGNLSGQLDAWARQTAENGYHGSVLVASGGKILLENGYGLADRESGRKQSAETVFSVGSITKQFTAAAIMKLESQDKLRLDDPLSKYFPDAPADKASITIHQLLTHSAGFPGAIGDDYENVDAAQFARLAFGEPLINNTVLPKTATDKMFTPHIAEGPEAQSFYGYGWVVQDMDGQRVIWHNGGNGVYNAFMGFVPATGVCVIVSSNSNNKISDELAMQLYSILNGKDPGKVMMQTGDEAPYRNNPVTNAIYQAILEKGAAHFAQNSQNILKDADFDFEDDMQLLGVGERLEEAEKWGEGVALYEAYTRLFPRIVVAWNRLGKCHAATGDKAGARAAWEKSVALRPKNNPAVNWLKE